MRAFLPVKVRKQTATGEIEVGFTTYGNKHLHSDTFGRSKVFQKADLLILPELLRKSEYAKSASLSKARKDRISKFHYYKMQIHGSTAFLNVAEEMGRNGATKRSYVYSVTDRIQ